MKRCQDRADPLKGQEQMRQPKPAIHQSNIEKIGKRKIRGILRKQAQNKILPKRICTIVILRITFHISVYKISSRIWIYIYYSISVPVSKFI